MNICFVNSTRKWGGVKSWTLDAASGLVERGHRTVIIGRPGAFIDKARELGLEAAPITFGPDFNPILIFKFIRLFTARAIDRVVINVGKDMRSAGVAAKLLGIPVIHRVGLAGDMENTFKVRAMHKWVRPAILVPCAQIQHGVLRELPYLIPENITVIPTGKAPAIAPPVIVRRPLHCISTSQLNADKGHEEVLRALAELAEQGVDLVYHVVGTGRIEERLRALAQTLSLEDRVIWHGFQADVRALLRQADIFLLPSHREGLPNALLEAMAEGLVCVARDVGGVSEVWPSSEPLLPPEAGASDIARVLRHLDTLDDATLVARKRLFWERASANSLDVMARRLECFFLDAKECAHAT
jgi:glycosyltransferase involved in cell wall biosynthesis